MNTYKLPNLSLMAIAIVAATASITSAQAADFKAHAAGAPLQLGDLPASPLLAQLEALPSAAQADALATLKSIHFSKTDLSKLHIGKTGTVRFIDDFRPLPSKDDAPPATSASQPATPELIASAFALHSKPGATNVIFLDFDGHTVTGTHWNEDDSVDEWVTPAFDTDGHPDTFDSNEIEAIKSIWRRVAEDYAPFNVDITTQSPTTFTNTTARALITNSIDEYDQTMPSYDTASGVAYLNKWGDADFATKYSPTFIYADVLHYKTKHIAEIVSHEIGHNLGLSHDGSSSEEYYYGHGDDFISWGAIMGAAFNRHVSQWSQGEYEDANNQQDDVAIITGKLTRRADDHANTITAATPLKVVSGKVTSTTPINDPANSNKANKGIIHARGDVDVFSFKTIGGKVTLNALPLREAVDPNASDTSRGGNMDIKMTIRNASNNVVATVNPALNTHASFTGNLAAGTYYVVIDGVGSAYSPYSDYGSLGQYFINGTIPQ